MEDFGEAPLQLDVIFIKISLLSSQVLANFFSSSPSLSWCF